MCVHEHARTHKATADARVIGLISVCVCACVRERYNLGFKIRPLEQQKMVYELASFHLKVPYRSTSPTLAQPCAIPAPHAPQPES